MTEAQARQEALGFLSRLGHTDKLVVDLLVAMFMRMYHDGAVAALDEFAEKAKRGR